MEPQVAFYRLSQKIVNNREAIPEDARQVVYYSLAIGHHVGVMDCFAELMAVPVSEYQELLGRLPDGPARSKLEGALRWQEIEINRSHVDELLPALEALSSQEASPGMQWVGRFAQCLREIAAEPALYLMLRVRA